MASGAKAYVIRERTPNKQPLGTRFRVFILCFLTFIIVRLCFDRSLFSSGYEPRNVADLATLLLFPTFMSVWFAWRFPALFQGEAVLVVGDDFVERLMQIGSQTLRTRIDRARMQSIREVSRERFGIARDGMLVKRKGKLGSWLRGYVFIPRSIEDYEMIKAKLMSWTESNRQ